MVLIPLSTQNVYSPAGTVPLPSHLTFCTPTKSNLYLDSSLETVIREPALYIHVLRAFQVPNLIAIFRRLSRLSKKSAHVQGSANCFATSFFSMVRGCYPHARSPSSRATLCRLSAPAYSIYWQLPCMPGGRLQPEDPACLVTRGQPNIAISYVISK
jgi:hypothetical protein